MHLTDEIKNHYLNTQHFADMLEEYYEGYLDDIESEEYAIACPDDCAKKDPPEFSISRF